MLLAAIRRPRTHSNGNPSMTECFYQRDMGGAFWCDHPGTTCVAPFDGALCERCSLATPKQPLDFFAATGKLHVTTKKKPAPKPCGGCPDKPARRRLNAKMRAMEDNGDWTVMVTTAPRRDCTLLECVDSIRRAGWEPRVFAEPGSTKTDAWTFENPSRKGVWHNWRDSASWCLRHTDSQYILTVQDDSLFHRDSRTFAESALWPARNAAFVSLYTPKHYTINGLREYRPAGINRIKTRSLWGACALIWDRRVLEAVIYHRIARGWVGAARNNKQRREFQKRPKWKVANSDTAIGKICNDLKRPMFFVDPSPVSHIARHSSIGHGGNDGRRNCYRCADTTRPLVEQVPLRPVVKLGAS